MDLAAARTGSFWKRPEISAALPSEGRLVAGEASGRPTPVAVETFHALKERQTSDRFADPTLTRVDLDQETVEVKFELVPETKTRTFLNIPVIAMKEKGVTLRPRIVSVVATSYLLGVSTRRVEKLVEQLGIKQLSKSQVSQMARHLDAQVEAFRNRPLDAGPYTFVWVDALVMRKELDG